jgi:hypothetical protein
MQCWHIMKKIWENSLTLPCITCKARLLGKLYFFLFLCFVDRASPYSLTNVQLGAQFCLNIFIYVSFLHVSGIQVPIIRRKLLYLCDTGIFSLCMGGVWSAGWSLLQPAEQTPPIQSDKCHVA